MIVFCSWFLGFDGSRPMAKDHSVIVLAFIAQGYYAGDDVIIQSYGKYFFIAAKERFEISTTGNDR